MTDTIEKLIAYNQWRRGDEELPQPDPAEIGRLIEFACDELRRLECERDEARAEVRRLTQMLNGK